MSKKIPQYATNLLEVSVEAVLQGDLRKPIQEWLKAQPALSPGTQRQVVSILLFLDLLDDSRHLIPDARAWRSDHKSLSEALSLRARDGYKAAGCAASQSELIGSPLLTNVAIGRVLEQEAPFQELNNADTRRNAIRFACHIHDAIVQGTLIPQHRAQENDANRVERSHKDAQEGLASSRTQPPRVFKDQGTIVNPKRYRVARIRDDLWVYATVQFEGLEDGGDFAWLSQLDVDEQARWQEQLAAALLQDADSLKQSKTC